MRYELLKLALMGILGLVCCFDLAADEKTREALRYKPKQKDVEYDQPSEAEMDQCTLSSAKEIKKSGFIVRDAQQRMLRLYLNTNGDQNLDRWSYFKDGIEVYCDIDSNFDGKADQFRWYGTAGTRWGEDSDGDGAIDRWLAISPEELSAEVIAAIRERDAARFQRLLPSEEELKALPLNDDLRAEIQKRISSAAAEFPKLAADQELINGESEWVQFGGTRPSTVAESARGVNQPITVYDSVAAVVTTGGAPGQIAIGTLIKVGDGWRAIELPQVVKEGEPLAVGGVFFQTSVSSGVAESDPGLESSQAYEEYNRILNSLEKSREKGDKVQLAKGNAELAKLLRQFIDDSASDEKSSWIKQFADQVAGAYQNGEFLEGLKLLNDLIKDLDGKANESDMGYAHYRMIQAQSSVELGKESDDPKVIEEKHQEHLGRLKKFIEKYTASEFVPEALYQLATSAEVDKPDEASKYYARIVKEFPDSTLVPKAQGAYTRINSKGRAIELAGKTMDSQEFRLSGLKGSVVVVHYWGAWPGSERDIDELRRIYRKYAASGIEIVGVGVENNAEKLAEFLKENAMPWTQLANERGLDGKLAVQLGIAFLPTTMLIGRDGTVINPRIQVEQLEAEIRKLVRVDEAQKPNAKK